MHGISAELAIDAWSLARKHGLHGRHVPAKPGKRFLGRPGIRPPALHQRCMQPGVKALWLRRQRDARRRPAVVSEDRPVEDAQPHPAVPLHGCHHGRMRHPAGTAIIVGEKDQRDVARGIAEFGPDRRHRLPHDWRPFEHSADRPRAAHQRGPDACRPQQSAQHQKVAACHCRCPAHPGKSVSLTAAPGRAGWHEGDQTMLDIVIRDANLVDGTGAPARRADIGVKDGRIVEVGQISAPAARVIEAAGRLVTPGFVDIHTHYDGQASWDPFLAPTSLNGVTSIAMGNCGVGFAPARPDRHDWLIALLEGVEDIPGTALAEGLTWDWESFPDYLEALGRRSFALDVAAHLPHAALRTYVMGDRGGDHREHPTDAEIARMAALTEEALAAGALGFTTSRTFVHRSRSGENIGTLEAGEAELLGIAAAMRRAGKGVIQLISDAYLTADDAFADRELDLIASLARASGRPLSFTVQQTDDAPDRYRHIFRRVADMVAEGLDVKCQVAPRPIGVLQGLEATLNPFLFCPEWRRIEKLPLAGKVAELGNPDVRALLLEQHAATRPEGFGTQIAHGFDRMFRMTDPVDYEPTADRSVAAEAAQAGLSPAEYMLDLLREQDGQRLLYMPLINYARGSLADVHAMMTAPHTLYGLSDGGAHCGTICDASFPTSTIAIWARGNRAGSAIPLETLVHGLTQRNARHVGWNDRGVVAPGYRADLNLIDLDALAVPPPTLVHDLPAGGGRLVQRPRGVLLTLCAGVPTFENGEPTGALPGRLLRA